MLYLVVVVVVLLPVGRKFRTHKTALRSRCSKLWLQGGSQ